MEVRKCYCYTVDAMSKQSQERQKGIGALILLACIFATFGIFARFLSTDFRLFQQLYLRIFAATILGAAFFARKTTFAKVRKLPIRDWFVIFMRALALYVIAIPLTTQGFLLAKYSNITFIGALPTTAVLSFLLLREKVSFEKSFYILFGFLGVVLISVKDYSHVLTWGNGELLAFIANFFFSLSYIARKWQGDLLNNRENALVILFISSLLLVFSSLLFGEGLPKSASFTPFIFVIILMAGMFNIANLFLINYGFQRVAGVLASNILMLESVFGLLFSILFFREVPTVKELIGGLLIIACAYRLNRVMS